MSGRRHARRCDRHPYPYLTDQRVLGASPAVGVKAPAVAEEPGGKGLKGEHLRRLLDAAAAAGPDAEAIVCLLALNGLRVSRSALHRSRIYAASPAAGVRCACAARAEKRSIDRRGWQRRRRRDADDVELVDVARDACEVRRGRVGCHLPRCSRREDNADVKVGSTGSPQRRRQRRCRGAHRGRVGR